MGSQSKEKERRELGTTAEVTDLVVQRLKGLSYFPGEIRAGYCLRGMEGGLSRAEKTQPCRGGGARTN